jgi:hypothetical protein
MQLVIGEAQQNRAVTAQTNPSSTLQKLAQAQGKIKF